MAYSLENGLAILAKNFDILATHSYGVKVHSTKRIHTGIKCNSCGIENFEGDRFFCTVCTNYNLCADCFCSARSNQNHKLRHPCLCLTIPISKEENQRFTEKPILNILAENYKNQKHNATTCYKCQKPLVGVRIKCDACYNRDLCYSCWQKGAHENHPMIIFVSDILRKLDFDDFKLGNKVGGGYFGTVYKAYLKPGMDLVACKIVDNKGSNEGDKMDLQTCVDSLYAEMNAHTEIRSAFICKLFGYAIEQKKKYFKIAVILEFMDNGTLTSLINKENKKKVSLNLLKKISILGDVAAALQDIHRKKYIHTDLKPDNVLVTSDYTAKISDFGIIKNRNVTENNEIGSTYYMPPEFDSGKYDERVDVYSFGLVMYHFMTGFQHEVDENKTPLVPILNHLNKIELPFIREMVRASTSLDPSKRNRISYYFIRLRYFNVVFNKILIASRVYSDFQRLNDEFKNFMVLNLYNEVISSMKNGLKDGVPEDTLFREDVLVTDATITKVNLLMKDVLRHNKHSSNKDESGRSSSVCTIL